MNDFLEFEEANKTIKVLNLDDFSIEDLVKYITELEEEIDRAQIEKNKKKTIQKEAAKFFK